MSTNTKVKKFKYTWTLNDKGPIKYYNNAGELHRENGPAIENEDGSCYYFVNGLRHHEDGPACINATGTKEWWNKGKLHRIDGPAIERLNKIHNEWWVSGKKVTELEFKLLYDMMKLKGLL